MHVQARRLQRAVEIEAQERLRNNRETKKRKKDEETKTKEAAERSAFREIFGAVNQHIAGSLLIESFLHSHDRIDDSFSGWSDTDHKPLNENEKNQQDRQDSQDQLQKTSPSRRFRACDGWSESPDRGHAPPVFEEWLY